MTTRSWSSTIANTNDADFRAWVAEFGTYCDQIGFPRHTDTGQINPVTVTRPAVNTAAGYEIRKLEDAGLPTLFVKFEFGSNATQTTCAMWMTVGTGTNGAGTLTGQVTDRILANRNAAMNALSTQSYFCRVPGYVGLVFHSAAQATGTGNTLSLMLGRTVDAAGALTGLGAVVYSTTNASGFSAASVQAIRLAAPAEVFPRNAVGDFVIILHGNVAQIAGDNPIYRHQMPTPQPVPVPWTCTYVNAHIAEHTTFTATLVGSAPRTYMTMGQRTGWVGNPQTSALWPLAMLWE